MFIVKKKIAGKEYYYLRTSERKEGKVKAKTIAYLGKSKKEAEQKVKEIMANILNQQNTHIKMEQKETQESKKELTIDELATFCKRKGFVFRSSEIYGGFSGFWDYGPLGAELFKNLKSDFWKFFVHQKENMVGIEGSTISHPKVWKASGHLASF